MLFSIKDLSKIILAALCVDSKLALKGTLS